MSTTSFSNGELFILAWQYPKIFQPGHFQKALAEAICRADGENHARLSMGYPEEVGAYKNFIGMDGWWPDVEQRAHEAGLLSVTN